jgi:hypothetical protein
MGFKIVKFYVDFKSCNGSEENLQKKTLKKMVNRKTLSYSSLHTCLMKTCFPRLFEIFLHDVCSLTTSVVEPKIFLSAPALWSRKSELLPCGSR